MTRKRLPEEVCDVCRNYHPRSNIEGVCVRRVPDYRDLMKDRKEVFAISWNGNCRYFEAASEEELKKAAAEIANASLESKLDKIISMLRKAGLRT